MSAGDLLITLGFGVAAELLLFAVLTGLFKLHAKTAATIIGLAVLLVFVPWGVLNWQGADIFAMQLAILITAAYALGMIGSGGGRRWHWAPALIVGFFIGVIVLNVIFLTVAEKGISGLFAEILPKPRHAQIADSRFPGTVSHDYQEKEALYNAYLEQVQEQRARGWQVRKGWRHKPVAGKAEEFLLTIRDREGNPVPGASVSGEFLRTSNSRDDFAFELEEVAAGDYRARLTMPLQGLWNVVLLIRKGDDVHQIRAQTSVQPAGGDPA